MLDFRKVILAAAVAGLGLVSTASAQLSCTANALTVQSIHAEGLTEALLPPAAPLSFACGAGTNPSPTLSVTVSTNAPISNVSTGSTTVANQIDAVATFAGGTGSKTVFGVGTAGSTSITFNFTGLATGGIGGSTLAIQNIRVNASGSAVGASFTVLASGTGVNLFSTGSSTVPFAAVAAATSYTSLATTTSTGYNNVAICNVAGVTNNVDVVATVVLAENFVNAWDSDPDELAKEPAAALAVATETAATAANIIGTRISVTFNNLAAGITYYVPTAIYTPVSTVPTLVLVPSATTVLGTITTPQVAGVTIGSSTASTTSPYYPNGQAISGVAPLTVTNGSATVYYAVTADNPNAIDTTSAASAEGLPPASGAAYTTTLGITGQLNLYEVVPSGASVTSSSAVTVNTVLVGNSSGYAQYAPPTTIPTATTKNPSGVSSSTGLLTSCNTTLLFPYLLTSNGYDTGIALTNAGLGTSTIPGGSFSATTTGTCNMTIWGAGSLGGAAITPIALAPITVTNGQVFANNLSQLLPSTQSTFVGYGVASCNFNGAHGFAQISNGSIGGISEGYLAPVLSNSINGQNFSNGADF